MSGRLLGRSLPALVGAALATLACALPGSPAEDETAVTDDESVEERDSTVPLLYGGLDTGDLASYRSHFELTFASADGAGASADVQLSVIKAYSSDERATSIAIESAGGGLSEGASSVLFVQIGDTSYFLSEGECLIFSDSAATGEEQAVTPDDLLAEADLSGAERVLPDGSVNGVMTRHYHFTDAEVDPSGTGLSDVEGDIWIAVDGEFVVRQEVSAERAASETGAAQGHVEWTYDLRDINATVNISAPAECEAPGGDFPLVPDATGISALGGVVSYSIEAPVEEVVTFYQDALPGEGWVVESEVTDTPGVALLEYARDGETVSVLVSQSEEGTSVIITFE